MILKKRDFGHMSFCYKKLRKLLIDRDMTRANLRKAIGVSPTTLAKMSKGEAIGANVLARICETMNCNVGDVMDYVPEPHTSPKGHKRGKENAS